MRRLLYLAAILALAVSCSESKAPKALVLYYSQTSTTKAVAQQFSDLLGADIEEIALVKPYDGSYQETISRSGQERSEGTLPELLPLSSDISSYDVIFLGYPIWFGTYALPIGSLLETEDFSGKTIVPFCTFGSGGLDTSVKDLKANLPDANVLPGYGVRSARIDAMPAEVDRFLKENGFIEGEYVKYDDFSPSHPVSEEESAIFDAAVSTYPMINAKAENVASRAVTGGTEYLFEARDIPRGEGFGPAPGTMKVYVLDLDGQDPVFTQVLR
jgi:flavodoxin